MPDQGVQGSQISAWHPIYHSPGIMLGNLQCLLQQYGSFEITL